MNDDYLDLTGYQQAKLELYADVDDSVPALTLTTDTSSEAIFSDRIRGELEFYLLSSLTSALEKRQYTMFIVLTYDSEHVYTVSQTELQIV